jgi:hypothetical protein
MSRARTVTSRAVLDDLDAEAGQERQQHLDVPDPGQVAERDRLVGQQRRGEDRQRRVLVAGRRDRARQPVSTLHQEHKPLAFL